MMLTLDHIPCIVPQTIAHQCAYHATNIGFGVSYMFASPQSALTPHEHDVPIKFSMKDVV